VANTLRKAFDILAGTVIGLTVIAISVPVGVALVMMWPVTLPSAVFVLAMWWLIHRGYL